MPSDHTVTSGETLSQIAQSHGFQNWRLVWDADGNADLRAARGAPERIRPGDKVVIPDRKVGKRPVTPGSEHRFKLTAPEPLALLEVGLFDRCRPKVALEGFKLTLRLPGASEDRTFTVPASGVVRVEGEEVSAGKAKIVSLVDDRGAPVLAYSEVRDRELEVGKSHSLTVPDKRHVADAVAASVGIQRRSGWGAAEPKKELDPDWDYTTIVIHHSGDGGEKAPKEIQAKQMAGGYDDIAYEYVVQLGGDIAEGRHIAFKSAANSEQNEKKLAILVAGDFEHQWWDIDDDPTPEAVAAVVTLVNVLKLHFPLVKLIGHRDIPRAAGATVCPGAELYKLLPDIRMSTGLAGP